MHADGARWKRSELVEGLLAGCGLALCDALASGPWRTPLTLVVASLFVFGSIGLIAGGIGRLIGRSGIALGAVVGLGLSLNGLSLASKGLALSQPALFGVVLGLAGASVGAIGLASRLGQRRCGLNAWGLLALALVPAGALLWSVLPTGITTLILISLLPLSVLAIGARVELSGQRVSVLALAGCAALALPVSFERPTFTRTAPSASGGALPGPQAPNVLLIVIDALRADRIAPEGTGAFADLARESVFFEQAISSAPWTLPAMGALMTGLYPSQHGAVSARIPLPTEVTTLAEALQDAGYSTTAFTGGAFVGPAHRLDQGFEHFDAHVERAFPAFRAYTPLLWRLAKNRFLPLFSLVRWVEEYRGLRGTLDAVRAWSPAPERPFFLFVHSYQIHDYYLYDPRTDDAVRERRDPPARFAKRFSVHPEELSTADADELDWFRAIYDERLKDVENTLEELLQHVRELSGERDLIVTLTSDHGEGFDATQARVHHGGRLHDDLLRVPWILQAPGLPVGLRVREQVQTLDLTPTLLDLLGLAPLPGIAGRSLLPALEGRADYSTTAFAEEWEHGAELRAVRQARWKWIRKPGSDEIYALHADPEERRRLPRGPDELEARLKSFAERYPLRTSDEAVLDAATEKHLQDLGYAGVDDPL